MNWIKIFGIFITTIFLAVNTVSCKDTNSGEPDQQKEKQTVVSYLGKLQVDGSQLLDENGNPVALHGMSLFWSQWGGKYYNPSCIKWLVEEWKCTVIRASLGINGHDDGYLTSPETELSKIYSVIDACIDEGIYVIIDWHDHQAENHTAAAVEFFKIIADKYGDKPNIIYEIYNEPLQVSWDDVVKPYAEEVISGIREFDPDNLITVGTPTWSQDVDKPVSSPIDDPNVAYTLHFYTSTHKEWLRTRSANAMAAGIPLFVTEFGFSEANGNGIIDPVEKTAWINFLDTNNLSWCNWSLFDKDETSAALIPGANTTGGWDDSMISESGKLVREFIQTRNAGIWKKLEELNSD